MDKIILDACCGGKTFWWDKNHPLVTFMDQRVEGKGFIPSRPQFTVDPDIVGDFRDMPFKDGSYKLVVFDPPHLLRAGENGRLYKKYGKLGPNRKNDIKKGFDECLRVLEDYGILIFKRNEDQVKLHEVLKVIEKQPLFGTKSGRHGKIIRLTFMKT